ncbi:MAG: hypothetical protein JWN70_2925 [Planctomycetaceae bacterium]|nr:hypothetical protein [Planctomycetaceae bacterium]
MRELFSEFMTGIWFAMSIVLRDVNHSLRLFDDEYAASVECLDQIYFFRSYRKSNVPSASVISLIAASRFARVALSGVSLGSAERA